ncbi:MAG: hypothetical protein O2988_17645 [Proteobacteria bacterium]|nr:hypothetical protein [Pseudomonadota bacterium]
MKVDGKEFERLLSEVYSEERFKRDQHRRFSEDFRVPMATILTWTARHAPPWTEPVLMMRKKLMECENENAKSDGEGS